MKNRDPVNLVVANTTLVFRAIEFPFDLGVSTWFLAATTEDGTTRVVEKLSQNTPTTGAKNTIVGAPSQKTPATGQKNTDQHNRLEIPWLLSQKTPIPFQKTPATGQKNTDQHNRLEIHRLPSQKTPVPQ